jgi:hypothetical protein
LNYLGHRLIIIIIKFLEYVYLKSKIFIDYNKVNWIKEERNKTTTTTTKIIIITTTTTTTTIKPLRYFLLLIVTNNC